MHGLNNTKSMENLNFYYITDSCDIPERKIKIGLEDPEETRGYYSGKRVQMRYVMATVEKMKEVLADSEKSKRATQLVATRDLESFKRLHAQGDERKKKILDRLFEILEDQIAFEAFLDYENHQELFKIEGQSVQRKEYLQYLGKFFGMKRASGNLEHDNEISTDFYIPQLEEYKERYSILFDKVNMDRYANPAYLFEFSWFNPECDRVIRKGEEPEWQLNKALQQAIFEGMPQMLTIEEQAMYIYCKMLEQFSYDTGYFYRDYLEENRYSHKFSKEHLESLVPGAKVTCWDFARVFSKLVNEIEGDIEAVILSQGMDEGHFRPGFYTDKVSLTLEAVNVKSAGTNDIAKAKQGLELEGIEIISDREGIISKALQKVYPLVFGKRQINIKEYVSQLKEIPEQTDIEDMKGKLQAFIKTMKESRVSGNEAVQLLNLYQKTGFFGDNLRMIYLGRVIKESNEKSFQRIVAIGNAKDKQNIHLLEAETLEMHDSTVEEVEENLRDGKWVYEDTTHTIESLNRGEN